MYIFPPMVIAESDDLEEADTCRIELLKDKKGEKNRGRWKRCINLYKKTKSFEERQGRAAYEIARLYHTRFLSSDQMRIRDLKKAEKYYEKAIKQNRMVAVLISHTKQLLHAVKSELNDRSEMTAKKAAKTNSKGTPRTNGETNPIDSDAAPPLNLVVSPRFSYGVKIGFEVRKRENRDFRDAKDDDDTRFESKLSLAALYRIRTGMELLGEVKLEDEENFEPDRKGGHSRTLEGKFSSGYLLIDRFMIPPMHLKVGRQRFKDPREWVYDEKLDALRVFFQLKKFESQLSISTNLFDPDRPEDKIINYISYNIFSLGSGNKAAFYVVNRRRQRINLLLTFLGISLKGRPNKDLKYWLELGSVSGTDGPLDASGYGFDLGLSARLKQPLKPYITLGYAFGSCDQFPDDNRDKNFRQTGLQDNGAKLWGMTRIKYYGELFDPELSNMMIGTIGVGIKPIKDTSLDIIFHYYSQVWTLRDRVIKLRDVGIKANPTGESRDLGHEIDLIFGTKITEKVSIEIISAFFYPGSAFANSDAALQLEAELEFTF